MKFGVRKPSFKKSFKARTTGKLKRQLKKAVIPGYGKKGMGYIKNPKKAIYNKVYNKTTIDPLKPLKHPTKTKTAVQKPQKKKKAAYDHKNDPKVKQILEEHGYTEEQYTTRPGKKWLKVISVIFGLAALGSVMPENRNYILAIVYAVIAYLAWQKAKPQINIKVDEPLNKMLAHEEEEGEGQNQEKGLVPQLNPKFNRTEAQEERSLEFHLQNFSTIDRLENQIYGLNDELLESKIQSIQAFNQLQAFCYENGESGKLYFDDMWLHCHNTNNPCFSFKDSLINLLEKLYKKYDQLPEIYEDDYHYFKSKRVTELKEILKAHELPISGKKEELIQRLLTHHINPSVEQKTKDKIKKNKKIILQNKTFIKEYRPFIQYYLEDPDIDENTFTETFEGLKAQWGFTPSYNDVVWGALQALKIQAMKEHDDIKYQNLAQQEINFLEIEGNHDQAENLRRHLNER